MFHGCVRVYSYMAVRVSNVSGGRICGKWIFGIFPLRSNGKPVGVNAHENLNLDRHHLGGPGVDAALNPFTEWI